MDTQCTYRILEEMTLHIWIFGFCHDTHLAHGGKHIESTLRYQTLLIYIYHGHERGDHLIASRSHELHGMRLKIDHIVAADLAG
jgi:hypothetical protein